MDPVVPELPQPSLKSRLLDFPYAAALKSLLTLVGGLTFGAVLVGVLAMFGSLGMIEALVWILGIGVPLAIAAVLGWYVTQGKRLRDRGEGLDLFEDVRSPLATTMIVRGQVEGRTVRLYRKRLEIDVNTPLAGTLDGVVLAALGEGRHKSRFGPTQAAREAALRLARVGVTRLEIESGRVIVHTQQGMAKALVQDALDVALAPTQIRFSVPQPDVGRACPYCKDTIGSVRDTPAVRCVACDAKHHAECWHDHGGCAVFRCIRSPSVDRERPAPPPPPARTEPVVITVRERA